MGLYNQTTEGQKYLQAVSSLAPTSLAQMVNTYKFNRAIFLGLPITVPGPQGASPQQLRQPALKLADRLSALGISVGSLLIASGRMKKYIEDEVALAVAALGGWSSVLSGGEWGFLLKDVTADSKGTIIGFSLPGLPFILTIQGNQPAQYSVDLIVAQDGSATASFTAIGGSANNSGDPL